MVVFVNTFQLTGTAEDFERVFTETAAFLCAQPGFLSHRLVRSRNEPGRYLNIALWESEEALRNATSLPEFRDHGRKLREVADSDPQFFDTVVERTGPAPAGTGLHQEVQHFYARQMRALDEGDVADWARTFEPDGVFDANGAPEPVQGRELIEAGSRKAREEQAAAGIQRRHWLGMLEVDERPDGTLLARTYALILATPKGGGTAVQMSTSCEDVLARGADGGLLVRHRTVRRDDLPAVREA